MEIKYKDTKDLTKEDLEGINNINSICFSDVPEEDVLYDFIDEPIRGKSSKIGKAFPQTFHLIYSTMREIIVWSVNQYGYSIIFKAVNLTTPDLFFWS